MLNILYLAELLHQRQNGMGYLCNIVCCGFVTRIIGFSINNPWHLFLAEDISVTGKFKSCGVAGCEFRYCSSCWQNLDHHCVAYYASKEGQLLLKNKKNDIKEQAGLE